MTGGINLSELDLRFAITMQLRVEMDAQLRQRFQDGVAHLTRDTVTR